MLTRIRNANQERMPTVPVPYSKVKHAVLKVLADAGWIRSAELQGTSSRTILVTLKYDEQGAPVIRSVKKVSTPGRRVYVGRANLPVVSNNFGMAVISTSQGMMTNREARRRKLGGEVVCEVY